MERSKEALHHCILSMICMSHGGRLNVNSNSLHVSTENSINTDQVSELLYPYLV